ncbi:MAG TPA: GtrA family protein [Acidimicrobiales bacterium]|nr:GtrA family protein [Acidimicrobiales bacterium]
MPPKPESDTLNTLQDPSGPVAERTGGAAQHGTLGGSEADPILDNNSTLTYKQVRRDQDDPGETFGPGDGRPRPGSPLHWVIGAHWLGRWRSPLAVRIWRYGAGSVVAFITSTVVLFVCLSWFEWGAITSTVVAFLAGAIPNWILNRRWAWERRGREGVVKETTLYVMVSVVALVASSAADKATAVETAGLHNDLAKSVLVTLAYMFSVVVLTGLKYIAYDRLVFVDRPGSRRSRSQVPTTTEPNRTP